MQNLCFLNEFLYIFNSSTLKVLESGPIHSVLYYAYFVILDTVYQVIFFNKIYMVSEL